MTNVVIASAARTAVGSYGKSLKDVAPTTLGSVAGSVAIERAQIEPDAVDHVVFGNVIHTSPQDPGASPSSSAGSDAVTAHRFRRRG